MKFTDAQRSAIDERGSSLIISAGAGSGKTAVLTERILSRICDENDDCNIDDFLIVTFTNAAAKELADRIRNKLSERASVDGGNTKILNNIALLPLAKISTINAFCYEIVRDNFQKLGLSASVRIADDAEMQVIRTKLMNDCLENAFEQYGEDEGFLAAYEIYSSAKNDAGFVETLLELDKKLGMLPDPEGFCKSVLCDYEEVASGKEFFSTSIGKKLCDNTVFQAQKTQKTMARLMEICSEYEDLTKGYLPAIDSDRDFARSIIASCKIGYDDVKKTINAAEKLPLKAIRGAINPAAKDLVKDCRNSQNNAFRGELEDKFACTKEQLILAAKDTYKVLSALFAIVGSFSKKLSEKKRELGIIEFADAERFTLSLLVESAEPFRVTSLAKAMRQKYKEIYIDEYQDVNPLQDLIFRSIARHSEEGVEYSRFMVGDIKQSIYRFRGASSEIFMGYRDEFSDIAEDGLRKRIFMSDNFRCCESVIGLTNLLFKRLMKEYYTDGDALKFSREEKNKIGTKALLSVFSYDKEASEGLSSTEIEALLIYDKIKKYVNNPDYTNADGKRYSYSDIGILARSKSALCTYEAILTSLGVPVESDVGERFYDKREIILCLDILNAIDNPERDIYLAGFMRSFAGGFSDDELALIKQRYRKNSLYRSVINYSKDEAAEGALREKCEKFCCMLSAYRAYSRGKSAHKLIWKIYCDLDLLNKSTYFGKERDKKSVRKNLLKLYGIACDFASTSFRGIGAFLDYVSGAIKNSEDKSEREIGTEAVKLMTIHGSKGLEFPICFVSSLAKKHNKKDEQKNLVFSENSGFATTLCDTLGMECIDSSTGLISINTPFRRFIGSEIDKATLDEEIRILYVALTRAKDMLIMTSPLHKKIENALGDAMALSISDSCETGSNYLMFILSSFASDSALEELYRAANLDFKAETDEAEEYLECEYNTTEDILKMAVSEDKEDDITAVSGDEKERQTNEEVLKSIEALGKAGEQGAGVPAKITVSLLKTGLLDEEHLAESVSGKKAVQRLDIVPDFLGQDRRTTGAEKGTAMHMFMQFADYEACEKDIGAEADRLYEKGFIDKYQRELLDLPRLSDFFKSDLYSRIKKSERVYREQRFNLRVDVFEDKINQDILVQGVIDLFFQNDDGTYTVVDFKTDRVYGDDAERVLIERHKNQLMYYKKAVEEMTGQRVSENLIYSFSLLSEISVE